MNSFIDANQVRRALEILHPNGELFEIRVIPDNKKILSGYFKSIDDAVKALENLTDYQLRDANVYTILGRIHDACYSRKQCNQILQVRTTTGDSDIIGLKWLFIDFDPDRPSGTSSTDEELDAARFRAEQVCAFLKRYGFSDPLVGMSGNGYHLLYKISLPKSETETIKTFLQTLANLYSDEIISIDTGNFNPSRPCKLYGTVAQKGTGTPERPHRMSYIVQAPEKIQETSLDLIRKIIEENPIKGKEKRQNNNTSTSYTGKSRRGTFSSEDEFEAWLQAHGVEWTDKKRYPGYVLYVLPKCAFEESHTGSCARLTLSDDGIPGYDCLHKNTCGERKWRDFRMLVEPEFYAWKPDYEYEEDDGNIDAGWKEHKKMLARTRAEEGQNKEEKSADTATEIEGDVLTPAAVEPPKREFRKLKNAADLLKKELPKTRAFWGVGDKAPLLKEGTCILSAKPKLGKSWLAMCLCLAAANGTDFLGRKTEKCSSLYLDLESSEELQQERLIDCLTANPDLEPGLENFYLETTTDRIGMGLEEQIEDYMKQDPEIGIVVIDVFQNVRTPSLSFKESEYTHAYRDITPLNELANKYHISIFLVMHNRKAVDPDNPFDDIMGSIANQGAASQMMVMYRQRESDPIHIAINGRNIKGRQDLDTTFKDGAWALVEGGNSADREKERLLQEYMESPIRTAVKAIVDAQFTWKGRCGEIIDAAVQLGTPITETPKALGGFLHKHQGRFLEQDGIRLQFISNGTGSKIYKIERYDPEREKDLAMLEKEGFVEL